MIWKEFEGSGRSLIEILSRDLSEELEENHEKPQYFQEGVWCMLVR
jgi:hypothetical protein